MPWFRRFPLFSGQNWKSMGTKWINQNQWRADFSCRYHFSLCILQALFQWIKCFYLLSILFKFTLWKTNAFRFADHHLLARPLGKHSILAKNAKKIIWAFNIFSQIWSVSILQGLDYSSSVEFHSILLAWLLMPLILYHLTTFVMRYPVVFACIAGIWRGREIKWIDVWERERKESTLQWS